MCNFLVLQLYWYALTNFNFGCDRYVLSIVLGDRKYKMHQSHTSYLGGLNIDSFIAFLEFLSSFILEAEAAVSFEGKCCEEESGAKVSVCCSIQAGFSICDCVPLKCWEAPNIFLGERGEAAEIIYQFKMIAVEILIEKDTIQMMKMKIHIFPDDPHWIWVLFIESTNTY